MDKTPLYPAPPLPRSGEPKWISLRQAAAEWARCSDRDENHYLDLMLTSFWSGDFERDGVPKVFTFEVPEAYTKIHKKAEVEVRLGPKLASYLRLDDLSVPQDDVGWVLNPQPDSGYLPIVVHEEAIGGGEIRLFPQHHLDFAGELWITTVDDAGQSYSISTQDRDKLYYDRSSLIKMLCAVGEIDNPTVILDGNDISVHVIQSLYSVLAKKSWSAYSSRGASILARLHISMTDLQDWAREKGLAFPFPQATSQIVEAKESPGCFAYHH